MFLRIGLVEIIGLLILLIISWFFSLFVVKPFIVSNEKQIEFISNASHELKTPITIMSSNLEIIKKDINNKWIKNIVAQLDYLNNLSKQLLSLSSYELEKIKINKINLNISGLLESEIISFEASIYENNKKLKYSIDPDIVINSDENMLRQVINIFIDNAIKYSDNEIIISLEKKKNIELTFYNSGSKIKEKNKNKIFDRFYKVDKVRTQDNSFGLGLSSQNIYVIN